MDVLVNLFVKLRSNRFDDIAILTSKELGTQVDDAFVWIHAETLEPFWQVRHTGFPLARYRVFPDGARQNSYSKLSTSTPTQI
jgi:hypothetical protein